MSGSGIKFRRRNQKEKTAPLSQSDIGSQIGIKRNLSSENKRDIPKLSSIDFSSTVNDDQRAVIPHKSRKLEGVDPKGDVSHYRIAKQQPPPLQLGERHGASLAVAHSIKISEDANDLIDMLEHKMKQIFHGNPSIEHDRTATSYSYAEETVPCQSPVKLPEINDMIGSLQCADPILGLSNRIREILLQ